jgi:hypothetical protein
MKYKSLPTQLSHARSHTCTRARRLFQSISLVPLRANTFSREWRCVLSSPTKHSQLNTIEVAVCGPQLKRNSRCVAFAFCHTPTHTQCHAAGRKTKFSWLKFVIPSKDPGSRYILRRGYNIARRGKFKMENSSISKLCVIQSSGS